jgi:type II secretory pathway pseudopilin PulG
MQVELPVATGVGALAAVAYLVVRLRRRQWEFSLLDALILMVLMSIATAGGITLIEAATQTAKEAGLHENLHALRTQIEAYRLEHGAVPVLYQGTFPQLTEATDRQGVPGRQDGRHPYGPYFRGGIPTNPVTGRSVVTPTEKCPPQAPSGCGGWLYHQKTGRIWADLAEFLAE